MKGLPERNEAYFERFSTNPVTIKPFDPRSRRVAADYIERLRRLLEGFNVELLHRGASAYGISGKGDIEIGVYPADRDWEQVVQRLKSHYGIIGNLEENCARFNDIAGNFEIEIIVLGGERAEIDRKLTEYLLAHQELLKEYERLKEQHASSRREYQRQKDVFFRQVWALMSSNHEA